MAVALSFELVKVIPVLKAVVLIAQVVLLSAVIFTKKIPKLNNADSVLLLFLIFYAFVFFVRRYGLEFGMASSLLYFLMFLNIKYRRLSIAEPSFGYGLLITWIIFFVLPAIRSPDFEWRFGANYNLEDVLFFSSTLDIHIFGIFTFFCLLASGKRALAVSCFLMLLSVFLLYGRRGPYFLFFTVLLIFWFIPRARLKPLLLLVGMTFWFLPLFWGVISVLLVSLGDLEFVKNFLPRNNLDEYVTATGRTFVWAQGLQYLFSNLNWGTLIGYGGSEQLALTLNLTHMHNVVLELFYQSGLLGVGLFGWVVSIAYRGLRRTSFSH